MLRTLCLILALGGPVQQEPLEEHPAISHEGKVTISPWMWTPIIVMGGWLIAIQVRTLLSKQKIETHDEKIKALWEAVNDLIRSK